MTIIVGLTGGIAAGKSTVVAILKQYFPIIDADQIARQIVMPGTIGLKEIVSEFGQQVLQDDGTLNRHLLGKIVFSNAQQLAKLNKITAPLIRQSIMHKIDNWRYQNVPLGVLDMPLLFEQHYQSICDQIVVVNIKRQIQIERLMKRNNFSRIEAIQRIDSQMPLSQKVKKADIVIDNNGTLLQLRNEVLSLVTNLQQIIRRGE